VPDLTPLFTCEIHPHGLNGTTFVELFTADKPVVFAFQAYQRAIQEIIRGLVTGVPRGSPASMLL